MAYMYKFTIIILPLLLAIRFDYLDYHRNCSFWGNPDSGIREILAFGIRDAGLWNPEYSSNNLLESGIHQSKFHWQKIRNPVSGIRNLCHGIQNPRLSWIHLYWANEKYYTSKIRFIIIFFLFFFIFCLYSDFQLFHSGPLAATLPYSQLKVPVWKFFYIKSRGTPHTAYKRGSQWG